MGRTDGCVERAHLLGIEDHESISQGCSFARACCGLRFRERPRFLALT